MQLLGLLVCALVASASAALPENHRPLHRPRSRLIPSRTPAPHVASTTLQPAGSEATTTGAPVTVAAPTQVPTTEAPVTTASPTHTPTVRSVDHNEISTQVLAQQHQQQLALASVKGAVQSGQATTQKPFMHFPAPAGQFQSASQSDIQQLLHLMQSGQYSQDGQFSYAAPPAYNPGFSPSSSGPFFGQQSRSSPFYPNQAPQYPQYQPPQPYPPPMYSPQQPGYPQPTGYPGYPQQPGYPGNPQGYAQQPNFAPVQQFLQQHPTLPYGAPLPYNPPATPSYVFRDGKYHLQAPGPGGNRGNTPLAINDTPLTIQPNHELSNPTAGQYEQPSAAAQQGFAPPEGSQTFTQDQPPHQGSQTAQAQTYQQVAQPQQSFQQIAAGQINQHQVYSAPPNQQQSYTQPQQSYNQQQHAVTHQQASEQSYVQSTPQQHQHTVTHQQASEQSYVQSTPQHQPNSHQQVPHQQSSAPDQSYVQHQQQQKQEAPQQQEVEIQQSYSQPAQARNSQHSSVSSPQFAQRSQQLTPVSTPQFAQQGITYQTFVSHPSRHLIAQQQAAQQVAQQVAQPSGQEQQIAPQVSINGPEFKEEVVQTETETKVMSKMPPVKTPKSTPKYSFLSQLFRSQV